MFAAALLSIFLQLALNTGLTKAGHSCDELKIGIHKRSDAYNLLCPDYDGYLSCCCSTIRLDLQVQQLKYKDQCQHGKFVILFLYLFQMMSYTLKKTRSLMS